MALVLTRKVGETIVAGNMRFTVAGFNSNAVSIAIEAPGVEIWREELLDGGAARDAFLAEDRPRNKRTRKRKVTHAFR